MGDFHVNLLQKGEKWIVSQYLFACELGIDLHHSIQKLQQVVGGDLLLSKCILSAIVFFRYIKGKIGRSWSF
jgi:hypothetical protein